MLTVKEHMRLQFEDLLWTKQGAKDTAARDIFGESPTVHSAAVRRLIRTREAQEAYPTLCSRLLRLEEKRRAARSVRRAS